MHLLRSIIASALALAIAVAATAAEYDFSWSLPQPQGNPLGGAAFADAATGYAVGSRGVVIRTTDGGASWTLLDQFPEFAADLEDVLVLPAGQLLAVGAPPGIFRSTDAGASWTPVPNPSTGRLIDIEVVSGAILSAIGNGGQVLRSTDQGATWALRTAPAVNDLREQWWFDAANGYVVGTFIARRTTDGGQSWQPLAGLTELDPINEVFFTDALHGIVFGDFHTWRSTDGGATWTGDFNPAQFVYPGNTIVLGPLHFLTATNLEGAVIFETTDGGEEWTTLLWGGTGGFLDFDRLADGTLIAVTDQADAYRSTDGGATWENATYTATDPLRGRLGAIGVGPGGGGAAGTSGSPIPPTHWYRTTDGGASWLADPAGPSIVFTSEIEYWDADRGITAGDVGKMWRTIDGGASWSFATLPGAPPNTKAYHVSLPAPGVAFAACSGQSQGLVYRTTDYGVTWEPRSTGIPLSGWVASVAFLDASRGFACGFEGSSARIYKTTNGGAAWTPAGTAGLPGGPWDIHWFDEQTGLATVYFTPGGIFRTTNGGATWQNVWPESAREIDFSGPHGFAIPAAFNTDGFLFMTDDAGETWEHLVLPTTTTIEAVAALPDGFLAAGAWSTIVRGRRVDPTAVPGQPSPAASGLTLAARATAEARIEVVFSLGAAGPADLAVVDVLGRRVATLARGEFPAHARTSRAWDGRTRGGEPAARGIYFVRLAAGQDARAVKVVLTR
jgi:photosystem II stability/assembly factor-like uncharacterized protein